MEYSCGCNPDECRFGFGARNGVATVVQAQKLLHTLGLGRGTRPVFRGEEN